MKVKNKSRSIVWYAYEYLNTTQDKPYKVNRKDTISTISIKQVSPLPSSV